ncbi:MAG: hypothetical protein JWN71_4184 [Xanthobacteraceae bacterium]|nr:hypothetical protein [Xanthobacteraceae bacterium]
MSNPGMLALGAAIIVPGFWIMSRSVRPPKTRKALWLLGGIIMGIGVNVGGPAFIDMFLL